VRTILLLRSADCIAVGMYELISFLHLLKDPDQIIMSIIAKRPDAFEQGTPILHS
jgi:hypothetical protein